MYDTTLVPTDGSDGFDRVAGQAATLASMSGATVHALYVVDTRAVEYETTPGDLQEATGALRAAGETATERVAEVIGDDATVERIIREGIPHREILDYAEEIDADLIVMGTHGRTGLDRMLLGSVAERVIRLSDGPVMAVKLGEERLAVGDDEAAVEVAVDALAAAGHDFDQLRDDLYRETTTWVVPVRTDAGDRVNVHVDAASGDARLAHLD